MTEFFPPRRLQIVHGSAETLDLGRFRVFAQQQWELASCSVHARIIGESSLVVVTTGRGAWFELITCGAGGHGTTGEIGLREGAAASIAAAGRGCSYSGSLVTRKLAVSPTPRPFDHSLEYRFAGPGAPLTRVEVAETRPGLRLRTLHDYPEAGVAVWSESCWDFG